MQTEQSLLSHRISLESEISKLMQDLKCFTHIGQPLEVCPNCNWGLGPIEDRFSKVINYYGFWPSCEPHVNKLKQQISERKRELMVLVAGPAAKIEAALEENTPEGRKKAIDIYREITGIRSMLDFADRLGVDVSGVYDWIKEPRSRGAVIEVILLALRSL